VATRRDGDGVIFFGSGGGGECRLETIDGDDCEEAVPEPRRVSRATRRRLAAAEAEAEAEDELPGSISERSGFQNEDGALYEL